MGGTELLVGAIGAGAFTNLVQGQQQAALAQYNAQVARKQADYNAALMQMEGEYNAQVIEWETEKQSGLIDRELQYIAQAEVIDVNRLQEIRDETISSQRVAYAAGNIDVNSGTAMAVQEDTITRSNKDIAVLRYGNDIKEQKLRTQKDLMQARGKIQASMARTLGGAYARQSNIYGDTQAGYYEAYGTSAQVGGFLNAGSTALSGFDRMSERGMI